MAQRTWRVGELAASSGLTVRTLRHYHQIKLLVPSARTAAGYRLYSRADVHRLYLIVALRQTGMSLAAIAAQLDGGELDPAEVVRRQVAEL